MSSLLKTATVAIAAGFLSVTASLASVVEPTASMIFNGNDNAAGQAEIEAWIGGLDAFEPGFSIFQQDKVNAPASDEGGDLSVQYDGSATNALSGSWVWDGFDAINLVVYKAGSNFVAHFFEDGIFGNMWDTTALGLVNGAGRGRGISHISVYGIDGTQIVNPTAVPLPAGGWLLLAGMGGIAGLKRRKARRS